MQFYLNDAKKQHMFAETCLYESVGSLPVMPSLLPPVLWGRSQVSFFLQVWWALWGLGVSLSTILWHSVLFTSYWWRKPEYPQKTIDLPQITDKHYYKMGYRVHHTRAGFKLTTLVVIGTDCIKVVRNPTTIWSQPGWPFKNIGSVIKNRIALS